MPLISSFIVTLHAGLDSELISFVRILTSDIDWKRARKTDEPPSGNLAKVERLGLVVLDKALQRRLLRYQTTEEVR
jgi:hypothetical protein